MKCILFGASGEVGGAVARALTQSPVCTQLTLLGRRAVAGFEADAKVEQVVVDTGATDFEAVVARKAQGHEAAISCVGVGSGSLRMTEAQLMAIDVGLVGSFARGCKAAGIEIFELLTAAGANENRTGSRIMALRVMSKKHKTVLDVGFAKLAIFKPGIIVGNAHTPRWVTLFTALIPDATGLSNIRQDEVARAFVAHLQKRVPSQTAPAVVYGNKEMKQLIRE
jgi:uncharacterized protein YbjT (DUF2867 family)